MSKRVSRVDGSWRCVLATSVLISFDAAAWRAAAQDVPPAAWMTYSVERIVDEGGGTYEGYTDGLRSSGRYDLTRDAETLRIAAEYRWIYQGERCEDGAEVRAVNVRLPDREYVEGTDLDDYDDSTERLFTWVWIPPELAVGERVPILEHDFVVIDREPHSTVGGEVPAIHVRAEGADARHDAYGDFQTTYVDDYWFDAATGYFLESRYVEHDRGVLDGVSGSFTWTETVRVSGASYLAGTTDTVETTPSCAGNVTTGPSADADAGVVALFLGSSACLMVAVFGGTFATLGALVWLLRRISRRRVTIDGRVARLRSIATRGDLSRIPTDESPHFAPFLGHFVDHALHAGEKVAVVDLDDGRCVGLGIGDAEGRVASIFARNGDACELLRAHLGPSELFSEHRHETLPSVHYLAVRAAAAELPRAYNVVETFEILELTLAEAPAYDASVVSRMTEADLPAVAKLSQEVHGVRGERWLSSALAVGDLGFVAKIDGAVAGYAFASVVGDRARLYGNTVASAHRSKGLGRELARARLAAVFAVGASRVVTEVATWNVASLEVVRSLGFAKVGTMWVETASALRVERKLVRR
jgi:L-amino acid N-acyltransferase YncA